RSLALAGLRSAFFFFCSAKSFEKESFQCLLVTRLSDYSGWCWSSCGALVFSGSRHGATSTQGRHRTSSPVVLRSLTYLLTINGRILLLYSTSESSIVGITRYPLIDYESRC